MAEDDSCFFDICLPNYTSESIRKQTYFNEISQNLECGTHGDKCDTILEYYSTPPKLPVGFEVAEVEYRGDYLED